MPELTYEILRTHYIVEKKSLGEIARLYKTHSNTIRRLLIKHNIPLRDRSKAQKLSLKQGNRQHPTLGKKRSKETKQKISEQRSAAWATMTPENREKAAIASREYWAGLTIQEKEERQKNAARAVLQAGIDGSKIEKSLLKVLRWAGYSVDFHAQYIVKDTELHYDIYLPKLAIVIEIDGPSHFLPIWGQERLEKQMERDNEKNGLSLSAGFVVIRLRILAKKISQKYERSVGAALLKIIQEIERKRPAQFEDRLIVMEI